MLTRIEESLITHYILACTIKGQNMTFISRMMPVGITVTIIYLISTHTFFNNLLRMGASKKQLCRNLKLHAHTYP